MLARTSPAITVLTVIGPDDTPGYGTTRLESVVATSTSGSLHPIVKCIVGAEVIYIVSRVVVFGGFLLFLGVFLGILGSGDFDKSCN